MAIQVKNLTTKSLTLTSDTSNEYLYLTNTLTTIDSKIKLTDLYTKVNSVGSGIALLATSGFYSYSIKTLKAADTTISIQDGNEVAIKINPANLDLSKCNNTTSAFLATVNLTSNVGATVLPTANGGTNKSTAYVVGDVLYASATDTLAGLAGVATGNALISGGVGVAPSWGKIALTTHVSGALPVANGGTGATSLTDNCVMVGSGTAAVTPITKGSNGQVLIGGTGDPAFATITSSDSTIISTAGSNTLALSTRIGKLKTGGGTEVLIVNGDGDIEPQSNYATYYKRKIVNVTTATFTPTAGQSGALFTLNRAGGMTITLPAAVAGYTYEFHVGTTFTGTFQINTAGVGDTLQGAVHMGTGLTLNDADDNVENWGYASPAAAHYQYIANADTKGRFLGTRIKYTAITDAIWMVEGFAITSGGIATPWA